MAEEIKSNKSMKFDKIQIKLASPENILEWSHGEVTKPETINYRTLKPEKDGLFCERIFGPSKDWECHCGKYKKIKDKGIVCDKCGVEVTKASVRRDRMGHIHLAAPVSHIWYFKGIPSRMDLILDIGPKNLEKVLYFASYIVIDPGETDIPFKKILSETEYRELCEQYGSKAFRVGMGAEAILELLQMVNLEEEEVRLKEELANTTSQKAARLIKRIEVVEAFKNAGTKPEWMILTEIPVIPPDLRPMVQLDGGRFATSDLNDLYRRIINRNNRLARLLELGAPEIIVRNEKRMLQEAVDALIDNGRRNGRPVTGPGNRALKSLSDLLKGKQGRFRQNLLGKRVDYSGRSVIVVGPELKIYQCGLPKEMAIELFKPFVMRELVRRNLADNIKKAKKSVEHLDPEVWDVLEDVIKEHPVMLNRAPTLHRLGIQAFEPILVEGKAIKLHPLVCTAFNADFDGDQMAVHLPLSVEAQAECRFMLLSPNNLLKPSDGGPVAVPSQDMVLGIYYLTQERPGAKGEGKIFKSINEAVLAYENGIITLHAKIMVHVTKNVNGEELSGNIESTLGRLIFNEILPQDLGYVDRSKEENLLLPEVDFHVGKKQLKDILQHVINTHGTTTTAEVLDDIKAMGYKYSTRAAMTVSISEMTVPPVKKQLLAEAEKKVEQITVKYNRGQATDEERHKNVIRVWQETDDKIKDALLQGLDKYNNIFMMADSGARGSINQIRQLAGMRGLIANTSGSTIEMPIRANYREGLNILEYFISSRGARKGLADTALRTADSGYLTRRLVDVSQDVIIRQEDCGTHVGIEIFDIKNGNEMIEPLSERLVGRYLVEDLKDPKTGEMICSRNKLINVHDAERIVVALEAEGKDSISIRSVLQCQAKHGVCAKCYGANLANGNIVQVGEAVGVISAQSIGEPGTQLTMRTFHTGGIASAEDITQGLPRVEELFEARKPKGLAIIAEFGGVARIVDNKKKREVVITDVDGNSKNYLIPYGSRIKIMDGAVLEAGDELTEGSVNPHDILKIKGVRAAQDYMLREVQRVYRLQGVEINDKHIEVIVRQMLKKIKVDNPGDSEYLPGITVDVLDFNEKNEKLIEAGKEPAEGTQIMLGITKAALATNSFLSAASFQETTKVLTEAAINGKVDPLIGLKENVLIGKLIPAGTGMKRYRSVTLDSDYSLEDEVTFDEDVEESADNADETTDTADAATDQDVVEITEDVAKDSSEDTQE